MDQEGKIECAPQRPPHKSRGDLMFDFVWAYYDHMNTVRDYGTGEEYSMTEVHMVTRIADNPGITCTQLACWNERTKGAISQVVTRLEKKGLICKARQAGSGSITPLQVTKKGLVLSEAHKTFDREHGSRFAEKLITQKGEEAVTEFYDVLGFLYEHICQVRRREKEREAQRRKEKNKE